MDKEIREWTVFTYIENLIKNMMTSLRALIELQNPAMRDRHWAELMETTNVIIFNSIISLEFADFSDILICL